MPIVQLKGHDFTYPISDILRLFYGPEIHVAGDRIKVGHDDFPIVSQIEPDVAGWLVRTSAEYLPAPVVSAQVPEKYIRREVKRQLYQCLSKLTGYHFPWGSLTGIRPTLVAAEAIHAAKSADGARALLTDHYYVSPDKADLALATARAETKLLARVPENSAMVYLGVPFCPTRCAYCSFIAQDAVHKAGLLGPYVEAVIAETQSFFSQLKQPLPVAAVYVGGGTPTSLPDDLFERLLSHVLSLLPLLPGAELTVEAGRPDTITTEKLSIIRKIEATRLCINPQTFHDKTLERIGRRHTTLQTVDAFRLARSMGFTSINMDLIAGLPGETPEDFSD